MPDFHKKLLQYFLASFPQSGFRGVLSNNPAYHICLQCMSEAYGKQMRAIQTNSFQAGPALAKTQTKF